MKHLLLSIVVVFAIFSVSCSKDAEIEDFESLEEVITMSRTFGIPSLTRAGKGDV
jgi:hypothetical protein